MPEIESIDQNTILENLLPTLEAFTLQGNLDPHLIKYSSPPQIREYIKSYLSFHRQHPWWILNLGHGVLPGTPEANLKLVVDTVKEFS